MARGEELTDEQWAILAPLIPEPPRREDNRGQQWSRDGTLRRVLEALAEDLRERGEVDLSECFIDGTFVTAKKGGGQSVRLSGAKARNSWWWQTILVFH